MHLTDHHEYSDSWDKESEYLDKEGVYAKLSIQIPAGRVLEIGCGTGRGSASIIQGREILALDNNSILLERARQHVGHLGAFATHQCDLFELTEDDIRRVADFQPSTIIAWFIGASGSDVFLRTPEQPELREKAKLYREKIEDIVTGRLLLPSVTTINLVGRTGRIAECSDEEVISATKKDYDTHVFQRCGFAVSYVELMDWPRDESSFGYGYAHNPNLLPGTAVPTIISIIAKRTQE